MNCEQEAFKAVATLMSSLARPEDGVALGIAFVQVCSILVLRALQCHVAGTFGR